MTHTEIINMGNTIPDHVPRKGTDKDITVNTFTKEDFSEYYLRYQERICSDK